MMQWIQLICSSTVSHCSWIALQHRMHHWRELDREIWACCGGSAWRRTWSFWACFHLSGNVAIASLIPLPVLPVSLLYGWLLHEFMGLYLLLVFSSDFSGVCVVWVPLLCPLKIIRTAVLSHTKDSVV